jgi:hypothetical protein
MRAEAITMNTRIYGGTARFDTGRAMTDDEMRKAAPSIFATTAHESRSERFSPIPTIDVLRALGREGFVPVGAKQAVARIPGKADFTKHLIRLRRVDADQSHRVGDTVCEMLLKNANDGTSAYELLAGLFRICCLNSVVCQTATIDTIKVRHSGRVVDNVIEGTFRVLEESRKALAAPAEWSRIRLEQPERLALAAAAHTLRFEEPADGRAPTPITPEQLLGTRRAEDDGRDLWTTFNVVQENVVRGGLRGVARNAAGQRRRMTTRPINGIDQDVKLNKALWVLADAMAKHKAAA